MKWLILLALLILIGGLIALRFRPQILAAIQIWRMFKQIKRASQPAENQIEKTENTKNEMLVRCANCGKWIPQSQALNLRKQTFYCSSICVEKAILVS